MRNPVLGGLAPSGGENRYFTVTYGRDGEGRQPRHPAQAVILTAYPLAQAVILTASEPVILTACIRSS